MELASDNGLLAITLQAAVPFWQMLLQERTWDQIQSRLPYLVEMIANHGDNILYRSKKQGETVAAFNALAESIAILSFVPGGVRVFGQHWEAKHPEINSNERVAMVKRVLDILDRRNPDLAGWMRKQQKL